MFPLEAFRPTLIKIRTILDQLKIGYHLTGGITSISYGEPRMTQDIDIVVHNSTLDNAVEEFLLALQKYNFLFDANEVKLAIKNKRLFQLLDLDETLKLDMYPRELVPGELGRSRLYPVINDLILPMVSSADAAASKLVWISKGSHKSRRDLRQIVRFASEEDRKLLQQLSSELNLTGLLQEVLDEPDEIIE